ncbi:MAG: hypothetical protein KF862_23975 [Chitinophagaceae bacterium]|nr:hypothetical protein [Chitinophagaceae bacterium]
MNAVQRIKLSRQLLTELSGANDQKQRLQDVIKKLKNIPEDCLSYEHFRKIRSIISDFELKNSAPDIPRISMAVVHLCADMIEYDAKVAELENIEY